MRDSVAVQKLEDETVKDYPHGLPVRPASLPAPAHAVMSSILVVYLRCPDEITSSCIMHNASVGVN